jgi:hypothetical protein
VEWLEHDKRKNVVIFGISEGDNDSYTDKIK